MSSALIFQIQSTLIVALLIFGVLQAKKNRKKHQKIMSFAMIWDILLIVQIEFTRHAVEKAIQINSNSMMLNIHVALAISTVVFYGIVFYLGRKIMLGNNQLVPTHKNLGKVTLILRLLTYVTSFTAV
jgi:hypothetical protein